jgi:glucosamine-6-phosphate deaminase
MLVIIKENYDSLSKEAAKIIAERLRKKPNLVIGFATGNSPLGLYKELISIKMKGWIFLRLPRLI